jgi:hypothetical protein
VVNAAESQLVESIYDAGGELTGIGEYLEQALLATVLPSVRAGRPRA